MCFLCHMCLTCSMCFLCHMCSKCFLCYMCLMWSMCFLCHMCWMSFLCYMCLTCSMCFMCHMYQYIFYVFCGICVLCAFCAICVLCVFVPYVPHVIYVTGVMNYQFIFCIVAQDLKEHQQFFPHIHEKNTFQPTKQHHSSLLWENCAAFLLTNERLRYIWFEDMFQYYSLVKKAVV